MAISFFGSRAIAAGFHQTASLPGCSATMACPIPTALAPTGRSRKSAPSLLLEDCPAAECTAVESEHTRRAERRSILPSAPSGRALEREVIEWARGASAGQTLKRRRLIDEHNRNVIPNRIPQGASVADKARFGLPIFQVAMTFRTDQNLEELRVEAHLL